jgi:hypothetical protein
MGLFLAQRWRRQPQYPVGVDRGNPLSRGLVQLVSGVDTIGPIPSVGPYVATTPSGTASKVVGPKGYELRQTGNGYWLSSTQLPATRSVLLYLDIPVVASTLQLALTPGSGSCAGWIGISAANAFTIGGAADSATGSASVGHHAIVCTRYDHGTSDHYLYVNGVLANSALSSSTLGDGSGGTALGNFGSSGGFAFGGGILQFAAWDRVLSAAEIYAVSDNPWQLYAPLRARRYFGIATGAGTHTTTGALTGPGSSVAGTATHLGLHTCTGALTGPGSTVAGTSAHSSSTKYDIVDATDTITGASIRILVPNASSANPYAGAATGVILYAHGVGEDQTGLTSDSLKTACVNALADAGYILAGTSDSGWGAPAAVDYYAALDKYVRDNYNVSNVCIWSQSMGGFCGLLAIAQGRVKGVVGWLGTYPWVSMSDANASGAYGASFKSAFGITGAGLMTYANQTYGHDPVLLAAKSYRNIPMRMYASSGDTVVSKTANSDVLRTLVLSSCRESTVVACSGDHGDASHFVSAEYVAFFQRCFATPIASSGLPFEQPAATKTVTVNLVNTSGSAQSGLSSLKWAFWDEVTPNLMLHPTDQGSAETTDGSGVLAITVHTTLSAGGIGWLVVTNSDGTTTQSPAHKAFSGPVAVS